MSDIPSGDMGYMYGFCASVMQKRLEELMEGKEVSIPKSVLRDVQLFLELALIGGIDPFAAVNAMKAYCVYELASNSLR